MKDDFRLAFTFDDVLLLPKHSYIDSRNDVDISTQISPNLKLKIPLISINMSDVTGTEMAIAMGKMGGMGLLPRFISIDQQAKMVSDVKKGGAYAVPAIGIRNDYIKDIEILLKAGADAITIDVAHAHLQKCLEATKKIKQIFKNLDLMVGVVATYEGAYDLFKAGADSVRVGVGPGSICITRVVTGVGVPQLTALLDCSKAAKKFKRTIVADGGIKNSGDIVKALAAGASAVILGNLLAGCDEAPGKLVKIGNQSYKTYNASTSMTEKLKQLKNKRISASSVKYVEGVESLVKTKGSVSEVIENLTSGIRSGFSYCNAQNIQALWKNAEFIRITEGGKRESGVHDVIINNSTL